MPRRWLARCLAFLIAPGLGSAALVSVQVTERSPVLDGRSFGAAGAYERVVAKAHFAVDPLADANRKIADIGLAPRNDRGQVEFDADLFVLRPRDPAKGNGTALIEISNRGGKALLPTFNFGEFSPDPRTAEQFGDGFLMERGFTLVWVGWEFDVPGKPNLLKLTAPIATEHGRPITGLVRSEWIGDVNVDAINLGDRTQTGYPVAEPSDPANRLYVRDHILSVREEVPKSAWRFVDETHVALEGGFTSGRIYEVIYRARSPVVAGLGLAAVRDTVAALKTGTAGVTFNDRRYARTIGFGISQSGRFLREFLYDGFNTGEDGRRVFDGVWAQVAGAGRGSFNHRFAQPSRDGHPFLNVLYPVDVPPFRDDTLAAAEQASGTVPLQFYTNGSYEYWSRAASLTHTTADAQHDIDPGPNARIYFFSGSQHVNGSIPPRRVPAQNPAAVNDYRYGLRALLVALDGWVATGAAPPLSVYPRVAQQQLTSLHDLAFPQIPGVHKPLHKREVYRLDFSAEPPRIDAAYPTLVPQVDRDGNELAGIAMPEVRVPLASHAGWNLRAPQIGAPDELYSMTGSWIPFALTESARQRTGDPRPSVEERYRDKADYLTQIDRAAKVLVAERFLLAEDVPRVHDRATLEWEYLHHLHASGQELSSRVGESGKTNRQRH